MDRIDLPGFASDIAITGNKLFVIYNVSEDYEVIESGVVAVDFSDTKALEILATNTELDTLSDIQVVGDIVFVTEEMRGVAAFGFDGGE